MQIKMQPMGSYQTNCYIVTVDGKDLIIDPGVNATEWVLDNVTNPVAVLNTHGHFDHVWSNDAVKSALHIPLYCPKDDIFMLTDDPFSQGTPPSIADVAVEPDSTLDIAGIPVTFHHFPGHTPGCSTIEIGDIWLSGDFLFEGSIGRWDFPYSSAEQMIESLKKVQRITEDFTLYPGHGMSTTLKREQRGIPQWIRYVESTL